MGATAVMREAAPFLDMSPRLMVFPCRAVNKLNKWVSMMWYTRWQLSQEAKSYLHKAHACLKQFKVPRLQTTGSGPSDEMSAQSMRAVYLRVEAIVMRCTEVSATTLLFQPDASQRLLLGRICKK